MKKLFYVAAAAVAVMTVAGAEAKGNNDVQIHNYYMNGEIKEMKHDMLLTGNLWKIKNRNQKQIWYAVNDKNEDVAVKFKGNDYKSFAKIKVDGDKKFVKDINPAKRNKHVAKIKQDGKKHVLKDVVRENGTEVISYK